MNERTRWHQRLTLNLWLLVVPPTAWAGHFLMSYLWAAISCARAGSFATYPVVFIVGTLVALGIILASGWVGWKQRQIPGDPPPHQESTRLDRIRFLATSTMLLAGLSFVAVAYTALPVLFLRECT